MWRLRMAPPWVRDSRPSASRRSRSRRMVISETLRSSDERRDAHGAPLLEKLDDAHATLSWDHLAHLRDSWQRHRLPPSVAVRRSAAPIVRRIPHTVAHIIAPPSALSSVTFWEKSVLIRPAMTYDRDSSPRTMPAPTTGVARYGQQRRAHPRGDRRDRQLRRRRRRGRRHPRPGRRHGPRRDHQPGLRGRHQPDRRLLRERRGLSARADAGRPGHGRRHQGLQRRPGGRRRARRRAPSSSAPCRATCTTSARPSSSPT